MSPAAQAGEGEGMMVMVMVIVMIHHGDTLYHDQADTAPLLGTYTYNIIYFVWMLRVWKDLQNQNGWELTLSLSMTRPSCLSTFLSRRSHWADG